MLESGADFPKAVERQKLEDMATQNQQNILEENTSNVPSDHELFAGKVIEELSEREIFVGDEHFYKSFAESTRPTASRPPTISQPADTSQPADISQPADTSQPAGTSRPTPVRHTHHRRFSAVQKVLAAGIVVIGTMLLYTLLKSTAGPVATLAPTSTSQPTTTAPQTPSPEPPVEDSATPIPQQIQKPRPPLPPTQPQSLKVAETFYLKADYDKAYSAYKQLRQTLPDDPENELLRDFLQMKMALCMKNTGDIEQAELLLKKVSRTRSPAVRTVANYHRSLLEIQKNQYLKARAAAYQVIALIGATDFDSEHILSIRRNCHFLVAESITKNVLSLCDADKDLPEDLWRCNSQIDPFVNLSEMQLRRLLNSGAEQLSKGLLSPQIQKIEHWTASPGPQNKHTGSGTLSRWSVVCHGASAEELLARFSANAGFDIHWAFNQTLPPQPMMDDIAQDPVLQYHEKWDPRNTPVSLCLPAATTQQFVTTAAGCVGLLARLEEKAISIFNPEEYSSLSEHIDLLSEEAVSLWQRFLLAFHDDQRIPNAHFALGLLQAQNDRLTEAVAEYKLVANRFSQTSLAPFALLHSSKLKTNLRDYFGAREDLKQLVWLYPDTEIAGRACLYLAEATMKAKLYDEAAPLFRKVYNLESAPQPRSAAALGAARCFYEKKDYESAAKWLNRYIALAKNQRATELHSAYLVLGKTNLALGNTRQARNALQYALAGGTEKLSKEEYVEAVLTLAKGHMQDENFIEALDTLENIPSMPFSQKESIDILLLKSKILRAMGLVDKAILALSDRVEYISEPQLKAEVTLELTECYIAKGNLELAYTNLAEIFVIVEPGTLAHQIALTLADVCLKLGQNPKTISICSQLLDADPSAPIKQKALELLAAAYRRQKNYDRALLALTGCWNEAGEPAHHSNMSLNHQNQKVENKK